MIFEFLLSFIFSTLLIWLSVRKPNHYPPGPFCIPILGNIQVFRYLKKVKFYHLLWDHLSKMYGPLVGLKFFNCHVVIASGTEMVKKLYNTEELNGRPDGFFFRIRSFNKRLGVVFTDGKLWEEQKLFSVKTLKNLGFGRSSMIEHIENETSEFISHLSKNCSEEMTIQDTDKNIFDVPVMNVMWKILRGKRFELDDTQVVQLIESNHKCFRIIDMSGGTLNLFPFVRHFFPDASGYRPLINAMQPLWEFLNKNIEEVSKTLDPKLKPENFIEYYCREMINQKTSGNFTHEQLLALCVDFFQAGSETTSNTLAFAVLYMLHYPDVMKKVQDELHAVVGDRMPKLIDRQNLKYSEAVICEVQRLANVAALGIAHRATNTFNVGEFVIPKNAIVLFNLYSVHVDKNYWDNPMEFIPERFLDDRSLKHHESFLPFGLGKRRCIGENLAKSSLFLLFTSMLHVFKIEAIGNLPNLKGKDGITLSPEPYRAKLTRKRIFD